MSLITVESLNKCLDELISAYMRVDGTSTAAYGVGEFGDSYGAANNLAQLRTAITETADNDVVETLGSSVTSARSKLTALLVCGAQMRGIKAAFDRHFRAQGSANYSNLETFLRRYNTGESTKWQVLQAPEWSALYNAIAGARPEEYNCYFEVLQGSTYANAVAKWVVTGAGTGTFTDGVAIDTTYYAGGIPALVTSGLTGSGDVTVTGTFYDPATKTTETSKTCIFTVSANGRAYRKTSSNGSAAADALLVGVDSVSAAAGITAGTIYVEAERPAFRSGTCGADTVTSTTVGLDDNASAITDFYVGYEIATNADAYTKRTITAYNATTKVVTVGSSWATNPTASTSLFRIYRPTLPTS